MRTTRSNEVFCLACDLILEPERGHRASKFIAPLNTGKRLLSDADAMPRRRT